uniref:Uncharacterized protein n=1 Tax=uncultured bacterium A1Q1_fos_1093 TaxID=1256542 RepID=L7W1B0_9BACT|nr:hypothetical protein [uncultured bacterium A1Q1_fos_1093]
MEILILGEFDENNPKKSIPVILGKQCLIRISFFIGTGFLIACLNN